MKDKIFSKKQNQQFEFDSQVASVFDDMIMRSIPYHRETIQLCIDFILKNICHLSSATILDLGSSTGSFLFSLKQNLQNSAPHLKEKLIGIDSSESMIQLALQKSKAYGYRIEFLHQDILETNFELSDIISAYYTIQFIRPIYRENLLRKIYHSLRDGGLFIWSEKMSSEDKKLDKQMIERYYEFKMTQGYSQNEITTKREALENVLIPYSLNENIHLLKVAGFKHIEVIFKWVNFGTLIAKK